MRAGKNKRHAAVSLRSTNKGRQIVFIYIPRILSEHTFCPSCPHMAHRHHAQPTMPQLNGSAASIQPSAIVSPVAGPSSQNGTTQSTIIQRLNAANEETWLLIGGCHHSFFFFFFHLLSALLPLSSSFLTPVLQVASPSKWAILKKPSLPTRTHCGTTPFPSTASPRSLVSPGSKKTTQR
jgi:hypothetical protein